MHISAVLVLQQRRFCVYKGKRELKLPITFENFVHFALYQFLLCFVNIVIENMETQVYSREF